MKKVLYISLLIMFSCSSNKNISLLKFKTFDNLSQKHTSYKISAPKGFLLKEIQGGNEWKELQLHYSDNSILYINDENGIPTINYKNIQNDSISINKVLLKLNSKDTLTVSGVDKDGKYWKNKRIGNLNVGYLNCSFEKANTYNNVISSIKEN